MTVIILDLYGDYAIFKIESYYFRIIKYDIYNHNKFCADVLLLRSATVIIPRSEYS